MNTKYIPPFDIGKLEEARKKINAYLSGNNTKSYSAPLVGLPDGIYVFNRYSGEYEAVDFTEMIPAPEGTFITIAHRKFECFGYYYDDYDRKVPIWGFEYPQSELKKLVREDRRMRRKAKRK